MIAVLQPDHKQALLEFGLRRNKTNSRWEGLDYHLEEVDLVKLELWELDQVLAGLRDRRSKVRIKRGPFYLPGGM